MTPLEEPETIDTPATNVIEVAVPKLTAVPVISDTVGLLEPCEWAPPKVKLKLPWYPVAGVAVRVDCGDSEVVSDSSGRRRSGGLQVQAGCGSGADGERRWKIR